MTGEQPVLPVPERTPFWGFADVFLVAGLALPCMFLGWAIVHLAVWAAHWKSGVPGVEAVAEMSFGYALLFAVLAAIFRVQYDRPFWRSLGWTATRVPIVWCVVCGFVTTILVGITAYLIHAPASSGPLVEMMKYRPTLIVLAIFGTTVAPLCEELAFRGFLQPLLVRNLGVIGGIAIAAALFGSLHYSEYGDSWRSALLVALAGAAFGCMRQATGSTAAAAIMHAAFNGLQFVAMFSQKH
jgi:membrane protease YdiL (CAAX protease family)